VTEEIKPLSLDALFKQQEQSYKVTVEAVEGDPQKVKITPWTKSGGCNCSAALTVNKDSIESVTPTGETHDCCGKTLLVVTPKFKENATLTILDVLKERFEKPRQMSQQAHSHSHTPSARPECPNGSDMLCVSCQGGGFSCCCPPCDPSLGCRRITAYDSPETIVPCQHQNALSGGIEPLYNCWPGEQCIRDVRCPQGTACYNLSNGRRRCWGCG